MFHKLKTRIIISTMAITTIVLVLAGVFIMLFSSTMRPEPRPSLEVNYGTSNITVYDNQELNNFIKSDREEGNTRLLITLILVGVGIEAAVFVITYYLSQKIVEPVKNAYDKQKLFIANASHELKTPLAIIEANMEAIDVDKKNEKWKANIESEITHANKLVLDLLQLAKMDAGNYAEAPCEQVNLNAVINEHMEMFSPKFGGKMVFDNQAGEAEYNLPKQDFVQVLDILLDNATKYGDKKITVSLNQNELTVANDGAKVKKADVEKIFDRFYQVDKTREGSGLGLAIAKAICEQNKWQIACESGGKITRFVVKIK